MATNSLHDQLLTSFRKLIVPAWFASLVHQTDPVQNAEDPVAFRQRTGATLADIHTQLNQLLEQEPEEKDLNAETKPRLPGTPTLDTSSTEPSFIAVGVAVCAQFHTTATIDRPWTNRELESITRRILRQLASLSQRYQPTAPVPCLSSIVPEDNHGRPNENSTHPPTAADEVNGGNDHDVKTPPVDTQLVYSYFMAIVNDWIRPAFSHATPRWATVRPNAGVPHRRDQENQRVLFHSDQPWKREYPATVAILDWCIQYAPPAIWRADDASPRHLLAVMPPVLTLLDDYDTACKLQGVYLVQRLLASSAATVKHLKTTGLALAINDAIMQAILYRPQEPLALNLLQANWTTLLQLTDVLHIPRSEPWFDCLQNLVEHGLLPNFLYHGQHTLVRPVLLDQISGLTERMGLSVTLFFKPMLHECCQSLGEPILGEPTLLKIHIAASRALVSLTRACRPRLDSYGPDIYQSVRASWEETLLPENQELTELPELIALLREFTEIVGDPSGSQTPEPA
ncbi:hypothetical protein H4R33_003283 [Dimargaris cristalligena]|nr:hypothetical protein H4R33_003283 [Dimargaris cristalligena]